MTTALERVDGVGAAIDGGDDRKVADGGALILNTPVVPNHQPQALFSFNKKSYTVVLVSRQPTQAMVSLPHSRKSHLSVWRVMPSIPNIGSGCSSITSSLPCPQHL
jgi:hypothetical protein